MQLHLDEHGAWLRIDSAPAQRITLALDSGAWAAACFRHQPPTALEIEHAIERIEDIIMPLARQVPVAARLHLSGAPMQRLITALAPPQPQEADTGARDVTTIEDAFNRLAARSQGRPPGPGDPPEDAALACCLVLVRELMHHWRVAVIAPA